MLAPRKTLWSTPANAIDHLQRWIPLQAGDCICDVGCGDGRVVLQWAEKCSQHEGVSFLGIDIDSERIQQCQESLAKARQEGSIAPEMDIRFVCANALQSADLLDEANIFFLYLIPRGLKIFLPLLHEHKQRHGRPLRVVSYMSKLPGETPTDRALCTVEHQPGAEWPLYFYNL